MKVTFLGTGTSQGIPVIGSTHPVCLSDDPRDRRLRVSILITWNGYNYVVDCGPDFRQQMLTSGCTKLDGLLFTHEHADHVAGMDDIRPFYFRQGAIDLYAHERLFENFKTRFDYIFSDDNKYPGAPSVLQHEVIKGQVIELKAGKVIPIEAMHGALPIFGYRFGDFTYMTDVKSITETELDKIKGSKVFVINALRREPHHSHVNLEEALALIEKIQPERAYLTHISHRLGFHAEVSKELPEHVFLAYDNLQITL